MTNGRRSQLLAFLYDGQAHSTNEIAAACGITLSNAGAQLLKLKRYGWVRREPWSDWPRRGWYYFMTDRGRHQFEYWQARHAAEAAELTESESESESELESESD